MHATQRGLNMTRKMYRFWLNDAKDDEARLVGQVETLKDKRQYTASIRQGLQLVTSLNEGKLDTLFLLFPWVQAEFLEFVNKLQPTKTQGEVGQADDTQHLQRERQAIEDEKKRLHDLKAQLERIEQRIDDKLNHVGQMTAPQQQRPVAGMKPLTNNKLTHGMKQLSTQQFTAPSYADEDDDDTLLNIQKDKTANTKAINNFLSSINAIAQTTATS